MGLCKCHFPFSGMCLFFSSSQPFEPFSLLRTVYSRCSLVYFLELFADFSLACASVGSKKKRSGHHAARDPSWLERFCHSCKVIRKSLTTGCGTKTNNRTQQITHQSKRLVNNTVCASLGTGHPGTNPEECVELKYVLRYSTLEQDEGSRNERGPGGGGVSGEDAHC